MSWESCRNLSLDRLTAAETQTEYDGVNLVYITRESASDPWVITFGWDLTTHTQTAEVTTTLKQTSLLPW